MRGRANSPLTGCLLPAYGSHFLCWILRVVPFATPTSVFPGLLARSKLHVPEPGLIFTLCFFPLQSERGLEDFPVVQWLRLHTPSAGSLGLIPGQGTRSHMAQLKIPHVPQLSSQSCFAPKQPNKYLKMGPGAHLFLVDL